MIRAAGLMRYLPDIVHGVQLLLNGYVHRWLLRIDLLAFFSWKQTFEF